MRFTLHILLLLFSTKVLAQDPLADKMYWYAKAKPTSKLFVHFDKNVYSNNEEVWFTGYLLKDETTTVSSHHVLAIALIRDADSALILTDKFIFQKGISFGNLKLPDSLLTGAYHFIVHTDHLINGEPNAIFIQQITIKTNIEPGFKANIKLNDIGKPEDKAYKVLISVTSSEGRFLPKPTAITYRYGNDSKSAKTDLSGQLLISLPKQNQLVDPNIYVKLKYEKDSTFISMALPQNKGKASVNFYPESGNLVSGLLSTVGWEVKDQQRKPMALKAFLFKNKVPIDTIETSSYGIGKFMLRPESGASYTLKLLHDGLIDSVYHLPNTLNEGLSLSLTEAAVNDTLKVTIRTNTTKNIHIRLHNFKESFFYLPFDMELNSRIIKIPLVDVPKGLNALTITDSLDRPLAERLFFAHYNKDQKISLTTDSQSYQQRSKVTLTLKLEKSLTAITSIAVVQDNRLEVKKMNDIESYNYLQSELSKLPMQIKGIAYKDKSYFEQILLVKGWRRYTWQSLQSAIPQDTLQTHHNLKITAAVLRNEKQINKALVVATFGGSKIKIMNTDQKGFFTLENEDLAAEFGKNIYVFASGVNKLTHTIHVDDPYHQFALKLGKTADNESPILPSTLVNNAELVLKSSEKAIRLKEVVIKNTSDRSFFASGPNACGDYVCMYNILNCPNHSTGNPPVKGKQYRVNGMLQIYEGCNKQDLNGLFIVSPVHKQKEFYKNDYNDPLEPAFSSTLYWNHAVLLKETTSNQVNFYTSDITGKFRIVVQGITDNDVIYAEQYFEVKQKK